MLDYLMGKIEELELLKETTELNEQQEKELSDLNQQLDWEIYDYKYVDIPENFNLTN